MKYGVLTLEDDNKLIKFRIFILFTHFSSLWTMRLQLFDVWQSGANNGWLPEKWSVCHGNDWREISHITLAS